MATGPSSERLTREEAEGRLLELPDVELLGLTEHLAAPYTGVGQPAWRRAAVGVLVALRRKAEPARPVSTLR